MAKPFLNLFGNETGLTQNGLVDRDLNPTCFEHCVSEPASGRASE